MPNGPRRGLDFQSPIGPPFQPQLFDTPASGPDTRHPGQKPLKEWMSSPDTVHHASFRPDWEEGAMAHVGSQTAASDRLIQQAVNIIPGGITAPTGTDDPRGGRIYARRLNQPVAHVTKSDTNVNVADNEIQIRDAPPEKVAEHSSESDRPDIQAAVGHLRAGRPVGYPNAFEDRGSQSFLAPKGSLSSWHQDVTEAQSQGLDVHPQDAALAAQKFDPAVSITPKSMGSNVEKYAQRYDEPGVHAKQLSMFPASTHQEDDSGNKLPGTEKLFETRPEDTDIYGSWRDRHDPGHDAWERAKEHVAANPGTFQGLGVRDLGPFDWHKGPEHLAQQISNTFAGQTHVERANHEIMTVKRQERKSRTEHFGKGTTDA